MISEKECMDKLKELIRKIRNKEDGSSSFFLACYESGFLPVSTWEKAIVDGIATPREYQACILILKSYRKLQAKSAIENK